MKSAVLKQVVGSNSRIVEHGQPIPRDHSTPGTTLPWIARPRRSLPSRLALFNALEPIQLPDRNRPFYRPGKLRNFLPAGQCRIIDADHRGDFLVCQAVRNPLANLIGNFWRSLSRTASWMLGFYVLFHLSRQYTSLECNKSVAKMHQDCSSLWRGGRFSFGVW